MAINAGSVVAFMELDTSRFANGLSSAGQQMKQFMNSNNSAETRIKSLSGAMNTVGSTATKAVTLPLVGVGAAAVKTSMDFEAQMSKVQAISGATGNGFNKLREQAIKLGADTSFSATEAAEGQENLASAGFKTNEILEAMPGMLSLAAAGDVDIATASDIAGSSLRGFGMEAGQATHVADVLAKTAADTNAGITDTGEAMKYIAPVAHSLGISFEDTTAAIGLLSNAGIKGSQAGTTLRSALTNLASPTKSAASTMKELGMNFFDAHGKMLPLGDVIQQLKDKTSGLTQQQKASVMQTLFGKEAMSGMLALVDQGPDKFRSLEKGLKNCDGEGKKMADTMQNNLKGAIEGMKGSIETMGIRIGDVLAPGIRKAADFIGKLADGFSNLPRPIQTAIVYLGIIAAAFGPTMIIFSKFITSTMTVVGAMSKIGNAARTAGTIFRGLRSAASIFSALPALINPPVLITVGIIVGLGLIVYEVIKHWDGFKKYASAFGNAIKNIFKSIGSFFSKSIKGWKMIFTGFKDFLSKSAKGWILIFKNLGPNMKAIGKFVFEGLYSGISSMTKKIEDKVKSIAGSIKEKFKNILGIHSPSRVFIQYGSYISDGLIEGLRLKDKFVIDKISDTASAISGKFTKVLDIHSPSKVFTGYGENIGQGLVDGMQNKMGDVSQQAKDLAAQTIQQGNDNNTDSNKSTVVETSELNPNSQSIDILKFNQLGQKAGQEFVKSYTNSINDGLKNYQVPLPENSKSSTYGKDVINSINALKNSQKEELSAIGSIESAQANLFKNWSSASRSQLNQMQALVKEQNRITGALNAVAYNTNLAKTTQAYKNLTAQVDNFSMRALNAWNNLFRPMIDHETWLHYIRDAYKNLIPVISKFYRFTDYWWNMLMNDVTNYGWILWSNSITSYGEAIKLSDTFFAKAHKCWKTLTKDSLEYNSVLLKLIQTYKVLNSIINSSVNWWKKVFEIFGKFLYIEVEGWKIIFRGFGKFLTIIAKGWQYNFMTLGKYIGQGLTDGIVSVYGKIKSTVGSVVGFIKNGIKDALGIHSPSRVMFEYGVFTGQGLINGMASMENKLSQQANKFSQKIVGIKNAKSQLDNIALNGAYGGSNSSKLSNNMGTKLLNFDPKINLYVTVADTGEKGTAKLTDEVKSMTKTSLKNGLVDFFMNDVIRD
ncbi:phage tail tape measure protein [Clostridium tyrobutyricum]|uniref:phage tail tape measure protein n=1 Tax=Clostridium tyrobutyricum TaxID=1519 RepID=UPI0020CB9597|nr:phage tail tape measure protein [Clostridium tyrobutyricum]